jgi:Tol biopolymer transport system component
MKEGRKDSALDPLRRSALPAALALTALATAIPAQTTTRVSLGPGGVQGDGNSRTVSISADGRFVAFGSSATNLVPADGNGSEDVFVADRQTGSVVRASLDSSGNEGNAGSFSPSISADGRFVAFHSFASNLVPLDTNGAADVFVRDLQAGTTERVSVDSLGVEAHGDSFYPSISADGRFVAFQSLAQDLVAGDVNGTQDVFVHDRQTGQTVLASVASTGTQGDGDSLSASISADGRFVVFDSTSTNLDPSDTNSTSDVFVRDLVAGITERVSLDSTGAEGNGASYAGSVSADGRYVAFYSAATNFVPHDFNAAIDVFVRDRAAGTTERISVSPVGRGGLGDSLTPSISSTGRFVAFQSAAPNLVDGDTNATADVFVRDRTAGQTWRVSLGSGGMQADSYSAGPAISADGRLVAFYSDATNLVGGDTNALLDAFVFDRECTGVDPSTPFCFGDGSGGACPCANQGGPGRGCANSALPSGGSLEAGGSTAIDTVTGTDSIVLCLDGLPSSALAIVLQSASQVSPVPLGDGLRCLGVARRLAIVSASSEGHAVYPQPGDPSVSGRSASLGDPIAGSGATRMYQAIYRDSDAAFCPPPAGSGVNLTNGLVLVW